MVVDVIDFTMLQKRGLLQIKEEVPIKDNLRVGRDGFVDLGRQANTSALAPIMPVFQESTSQIPDFFSSLAQANVTAAEPVKNLASDDKLDSILMAIETSNYRIGEIYKRISKIEDKVQEIARIPLNNNPAF